MQYGGTENSSTSLLDSAEDAYIGKENQQILPKTLRRVLHAIKEFNFSYSVLTP